MILCTGRSGAQEPTNAAPLKKGQNAEVVGQKEPYYVEHFSELSKFA
jgi:hypothetical protein